MRHREVVATTLALRGSFEGQGFPPLRVYVCARTQVGIGASVSGERIRRGPEGRGCRRGSIGVRGSRGGDRGARGWPGVCVRGGESPVPSIYSACEPVDSG